MDKGTKEMVLDIADPLEYSLIYIQYQQQMHCLNYRIGFLFRQNLQKKTYEMRYFFIDDDANLFYLPSLARLQKLIRLSSDFKEIKLKLVKMGEKSFSLNKYAVHNPKNYQSDAVLPFCNRTCVEIKEKEGKDERGYQLFGLIDEDTPLLYQEILRLTGRKKVENSKRKSVIQDQKNKHEVRTLQFFKRFLANQQRFKMSSLTEDNKDIDFQGDMPASQANGKCVETLINMGITYTGHFVNGMKNGTGLLVSDSLDSLDCQFLDDQLVGI